MSYIPEDNIARKMLPLFKYVTEYFPKALREACRVSVVNNVRYNPERDPADINWARGKSTDQLGSAFRHMMERKVDGKVFENVPSEIAKKTGIQRVYVLAEAYWRLGAALELEIEQQEALDQQEAIDYHLAWSTANQSNYAGERGGDVIFTSALPANGPPGELNWEGAEWFLNRIPIDPTHD
jgi:hypothetical protein